MVFLNNNIPCVIMSVKIIEFNEGDSAASLQIE